MNGRLERIIELAEVCNVTDFKTKSTDLENSIKMDYAMEIRELYKGIDKNHIREDIIFLMEFLQKIERSHGSSKGKEFIIEAIADLEKIQK